MPDLAPAVRRVSRRRKPAAPATPPRLYSLTANQARWLTEARDAVVLGRLGAYIPITAGCEPGELVEAGAATFHEEHRRDGTRGPHDPRQCEWTDYYLVPTEHGLELLRGHRG
jgi:hypothetical protein